MNYFTSDVHFNSEPRLKLENRGFKTSEQFDRHINTTILLSRYDDMLMSNTLSLDMIKTAVISKQVLKARIEYI